MFSVNDLSYMRKVQTDHMMDTCIIQTMSRTLDSYGQMIESYTDGTAQACGLDMRPGSERKGTDSTMLEYDATLRLAITAAPDAKDRIKITHRFGEAITPLVYDIAGPIQRGPSGIRLLLKRVEA